MNGYGKPSRLLSETSLSAELKVCARLPLEHGPKPNGVQSEYAAGLLYILSLAFAKLAVLILVKSITPHHREQRAAYSLATLVVLWAITGLFAAAFMCHVPTTWDWQNGQCNDRVQPVLSCLIFLC